MRYELIAYAQRFYDSKGFTDKEVPWVVSERASNITKPDFANNTYVSNTNVGYGHAALVASGEQGFLQLILDKQLKYGFYQTTTPCFRTEMVYNQLTRPYFMKTELIMYLKDDFKYHFEHMLRIGLEFHRSIGLEVELEEMGEDQVDIVDTHGGVELGSYGIRTHDDFTWAYGTGLALPRTEVVLKYQQDYNLKMNAVPNYIYIKGSNE
jgi:seryl-tRNA synthetase